MSFNKTGVINYSGSPNENLLLSTPRTNLQTSYLAYTLNLSENLVAGQTYILQLWDVDISNNKKTDDQLRVSVYWGGGNISIISLTVNKHVDYITGTFTITQTQAEKPTAVNAWLCLYNTPPSVSGAVMNMTVGKWKLEKGNIPTNWIPCKKDEMNVGSPSFIEKTDITDIAKIQSNGYIQAPEFIEI